MCFQVTTCHYISSCSTPFVIQDLHQISCRLLIPNWLIPSEKCSWDDSVGELGTGSDVTTATQLTPDNCFHLCVINAHMNELPCYTLSYIPATQVLFSGKGHFPHMAYICLPATSDAPRREGKVSQLGSQATAPFHFYSTLCCLSANLLAPGWESQCWTHLQRVLT